MGLWDTDCNYLLCIRTIPVLTTTIKAALRTPRKLRFLKKAAEAKKILWSSEKMGNVYSGPKLKTEPKWAQEKGNPQYQ